MSNKFSISSILHTSRERRDVSCDPLSDTSYIGGPYTKTQWCTNALATSVEVIFFIGTVRTSPVNRSVMNSK